VPLRAILLVFALVCAGVAAGCGEDERGGSAEAVEAREQNEARLAGLGYRVPLFRQLNPRILPDKRYYQGPRPPADSGVYAAFLRVCNPAGATRTPTGRIYLEDAFGQRFEPVLQPENEHAYDPRPIGADHCLPPDTTPTTADGAVVAFIVPFESTAERPLVLVIKARTGEDARIELDL
jgi:hypothetical protein